LSDVKDHVAVAEAGYKSMAGGAQLCNKLEAEQMENRK
jgi:hypothetical protein